jgi:hypothetical protein
MKQIFLSFYLFFSIIFDLGYYFVRSFLLTEKEYKQINDEIDNNIFIDLLIGGEQ